MLLRFHRVWLNFRKREGREFEHETSFLERPSRFSGTRNAPSLPFRLPSSEYRSLGTRCGNGKENSIRERDDRSWGCGCCEKKNRGNAGSASLSPSRPCLKVDTESSAAESQIFFYTVKPLLSGPPIKRTPSIKRTLSRVPKLTSYISLYNEPLFSGQ